MHALPVRAAPWQGMQAAAPSGELARAKARMTSLFVGQWCHRGIAASLLAQCRRQPNGTRPLASFGAWGRAGLCRRMHMTHACVPSMIRQCGCLPRQRQAAHGVRARARRGVRAQQRLPAAADAARGWRQRRGACQGPAVAVRARAGQGRAGAQPPFPGMPPLPCRTLPCPRHSYKVRPTTSGKHRLFATVRRAAQQLVFRQWLMSVLRSGDVTSVSTL